MFALVKVKMIAIKSLGLAALLLLFSCEDDFESPPLIVENQILELVNQHRESIGKDRLILDVYMTFESRTHSKNMANEIVPFGHDGFGDRAKRIKEKLGGRGTGENVAFGYNSAEGVMTGWLNSKGHRANIEGDYTHIGIGVYANEGGRIFYTQIFLSK